VAVVIGINSVN